MNKQKIVRKRSSLKSSQEKSSDFVSEIVYNIFNVNRDIFSHTYKDITIKKVSDYLNNFSEKELLEAQLAYKKLSKNKKGLFLNTVLYNSSNYPKNHKLFFNHTLSKELFRINAGMLNQNYSFPTGYSSCNKTINGFIKAFRNDTVFTAKINIDGKLTRVFVKNLFYTNSFFKMGTHSLILEPKTLSVYNLRNYYSGSYGSLNLKDFKKIKIKSKDRLTTIPKLITFYGMNPLKEDILKMAINKHHKRYSLNIKKARQLHKKNLVKQVSVHVKKARLSSEKNKLMGKSILSGEKSKLKRNKTTQGNKFRKPIYSKKF